MTNVFVKVSNPNNEFNKKLSPEIIFSNQILIFTKNDLIQNLILPRTFSASTFVSYVQPQSTRTWRSECWNSFRNSSTTSTSATSTTVSTNHFRFEDNSVFSWFQPKIYQKSSEPHTPELLCTYGLHREVRGD